MTRLLVESLNLGCPNSSLSIELAFPSGVLTQIVISPPLLALSCDCCCISEVVVLEAGPRSTLITARKILTRSASSSPLLNFETVCVPSKVAYKCCCGVPTLEGSGKGDETVSIDVEKAVLSYAIDLKWNLGMRKSPETESKWFEA